MRFTVERDALAEAVAWSARSLPSRPPLPLLAGLVLGVEGDELTVSGFDYEVSTQASLDVSGEENGRVLVSGRLLAEISRALPAHPVDVRTDGARVAVVCGTSRFTLPTMPVQDYPDLPQMPAVTGAVASEVFAGAVASVAVAAGRDDTLPVLTGVKVEIDGSDVTLAATDRYRLAVRTMPWTPSGDLSAASALVPARTLAETAKAMNAGPQVGIALELGGAGAGMIGFDGGRRRTTTRLLDGEFPKYQSLLPADSAAVASVETAALADAVRRVSLVAARTAPVRLAFTGDELVLEAGGTDEAEASEALPASYEGDPMTIAFNPGFLLDGLGAIDSDSVTLAFTTPTKPAVLTGKDPDVYRYLLMPVRLSG